MLWILVADLFHALLIFTVLIATLGGIIGMAQMAQRWRSRQREQQSRRATSVTDRRKSRTARS